MSFLHSMCSRLPRTVSKIKNPQPNFENMQYAAKVILLSGSGLPPVPSLPRLHLKTLWTAVILRKITCIGESQLKKLFMQHTWHFWIPSLDLLLIVLLILTNTGSITEVCCGGIFTGYFYFYLRPASPCITGPWMHRTHSRLTRFDLSSAFLRLSSVTFCSTLQSTIANPLQFNDYSFANCEHLLRSSFRVSCKFSVYLFRPLPNNLHALISYFLSSPPLTSMLESWRFLLFPEVWGQDLDTLTLKSVKIISGACFWDQVSSVQKTMYLD